MNAIKEKNFKAIRDGVVDGTGWFGMEWPAYLPPSAGNEPSGGGRHCQTAKTRFRWADVVFGPMGADGADVVFTETLLQTKPRDAAINLNTR